ncbi:MAG TPA: PAS domain S-box protein [Thermoanaerobaculia bacterium]|jgi:PAS domain S-box-containing protein
MEIHPLPGIAADADAQRRLLESEECFRTTFERAAVGMVHAALTGAYVRVNRRFCDIVGYTAEELMAMTFIDLTHPDDLRDDLNRRAALIVGTIESARSEKRYIRKDGTVIWVAVTVALGCDSQSGDRYFIGVVEDISAQRQAEDALRASEQKYRLLLENASDAILIAGADHRFVQVNAKACEISGFTREELLTKRIEDLVVGAAIEDAVPALEGGRTLLLELRLLRADGSSVQVEISLSMHDGLLHGSVRDITDRKRAEAELRTSEQRFELVTQATNDAIYDWDVVTNAIWWSDTFYAAFGYPRSGDYSYEWWVSKIHPEDAELVIPELDAALAGTDSYWSGDYRLLTANGTYADVFDRCIIVRDAAGKVMRTIGSVMDVTARKAAETALRASEARFRRLFESNMLGVSFWHMDGGVLDANDAYLQMTGYTRDDLRRGDVNWRVMTPPEMRELDATADLEMLATGVCAAYQKEYVRKDGTRVAVLVGGALLDGKRDIGVAYFADITERRSAEEFVRLNEERFRAMIENNTEVIAILTEDGIVRYESPSVERLFGYAPDELIGTNALDLVHLEDLPRVVEIFEKARSQAGTTPRIEYRYRHKDGNWRTVESIGNNLLDHPAVQGIVVTTRDVTERKLFQAQLDQAERLSSLGRLAATIAHEFNNVLMGIQPFAEVIRRVAANDPMLTDASHHISTAVQRGKRISQDILRFTQPAQPTLAALQVRRWLVDLEAELRGLVAPQCELVVVMPQEHPSIVGDAFQLSQVLSNLVLNARDAMPRGGRITIIADEPTGDIIYPFAFVPNAGNFVHLAVRDTGAGISAENLSRVFEPLFTTKKNGTGLGLAVAHQVVERHRGHIFVESEIGVGTTFHLFIPRQETARSSERRRTGELALPQRRRILLIEDDLAVAEGTATLLTMSDFDVHIASTGRSSLAAAESFRPDAVILDVALPDISGLDVYAQLAAKWPTLPVVFSTAHGDRRAVEELRGDRRVEFLQKPYEFDALASSLERLLRVVA